MTPDALPAGAVAGWRLYNPFSKGRECKAYTGAGWTRADAEADRAAVFQETVGHVSAAYIGILDARLWTTRFWS